MPESRRRVPVDIVNTHLAPDDDDADQRLIPGVEGTCTDCDHKTRAYGRGPASRTRVLAKMRETCPNQGGSCPQKNFYVES